MRQAAGGLRFGPTLNGEDATKVPRAQNPNHALPINNPITAGAAHRRAGDLASLRVRMFHGNVLGMHVHQKVQHGAQPLVRVSSGQVHVSRVVVHPQKG